MMPRSFIFLLAIASISGAFFLGRGSVSAPEATSPIPGLSGKDIPVAIPFPAKLNRIYSESDKVEKGRDLARFFGEWLEADPLAAFSEVRRVESIRHDPIRTMASFRTWANENPAQAAELLGMVLDGRQADVSQKPAFIDGIDPPEFVLAIVHGLGLRDPELAASTLASAAYSPVVADAISVLLQDWYVSDPGGVQRWAASLEDEKLRQPAIAITAGEAGQTDPQPGIDWAMTLSESDQSIALGELVSQWSQRHSTDAFAWTVTLPDGELKFAIMPTVLRQLTITDPGAAADWLDQYEPSPEMDDSIGAYARSVLTTNPAAALGSLSAIQDGEKRDALGRRLLQQWRNIDPEAARRFTERATKP